MTQIGVDRQVATMINVFSVDPENQQRLVDLLVETTESVMRHVPGFVSANIHASLDGGRVVNYAQWRTVEDFQAMLANPEAQPHLAACAALATFEPHLFTVVSVHHS